MHHHPKGTRNVMGEGVVIYLFLTFRANSIQLLSSFSIEVFARVLLQKLSWF